MGNAYKGKVLAKKVPEWGLIEQIAQLKYKH